MFVGVQSTYSLWRREDVSGNREPQWESVLRLENLVDPPSPLLGIGGRLLFSGLYPFVLPSTAKGRDAPTETGGQPRLHQECGGRHRMPPCFLHPTRVLSDAGNVGDTASPREGRQMKSQAKTDGESASELINERIAELGDWRGDTLARVRALIKEAVPEVVEEWKWRGTPVWSHGGGICTGEAYKKAVKLTFFKGASLEDPAGLFNSSLDGNVRRAIDIHEGEVLDAKAFKALIRAAVALNTSSGKKPTKRSK
ncbi:hypothetical protein MVI01_42050 [Myxococcus virescens]|uniref:YdhG-like domain-containing protein n=2 Tax=Myxococcus virescens TaxID=83456 RepID=A0A511HFV5_9BACT|nr:hypothetical protein MVI01_42050 [Myxococcus virescens]SDF06632.1 hypothetical protein SAMN04488504_11922 [Myxococcus virescens]